jgi:GntR family transcriptional repressor for pyruvate dehydrogenase complex
MKKKTNIMLLATALGPVKKTDITHLVLDRLKYLLESGIIGPGSKLPTEHEMSKALGVSRPSLRQAYKALDVLGIIRAVSGDGTYINESSSKILSTPLTFLMLMKKISLDEVFEFRILLECELAGLAASRASSEEIKVLSAGLETMGNRLGDKTREGYLEAEYEFHNWIARAAHHALLFEIISMVSGLLWETRKRLVNFVVNLSADLEEHRSIYEAIRERDPILAQQAMRSHLLGAIKLTRRKVFSERKEA